jgi:hypothetical protein
MNNTIMAVGVIVVILFGTWLGYSTNSLQGGIVGAIGLLNCIILLNLSYQTKKI